MTFSAIMLQVLELVLSFMQKQGKCHVFLTAPYTSGGLSVKAVRKQ